MANTSKILRIIAKIDAIVTKQLNAILAHHTLQQITSNWLSINLLIASSEAQASIIIRLLDISSSEFAKDLANPDIEISTLYNFLYEQEAGSSGGEPFNIIHLVGLQNVQQLKIVENIQKLCEISASALAITIMDVSAESFGSVHFSELTNIKHHLNSHYLQHWNKFREQVNSKFLVACLPGTTFKYPIDSVVGLKYHVEIPSSVLLLQKILEAFSQERWFLELHGKTNHLSLLLSNIIKNIELNVSSYFLDSEHNLLAKNGFTSVQRGSLDNALYFNEITTAFINTAPPETLLEHMLSACRISHYIKLLAREKIGSFSDEDQCKKFIDSWLNKHTATIKNRQQLYQYPLNNFHIELFKIPGKIGHFGCKIQLEPHMKLQSLNSKITLKSEIILE